MCVADFRFYSAARITMVFLSFELCIFVVGVGASGIANRHGRTVSKAGMIGLVAVFSLMLYFGINRTLQVHELPCLFSLWLSSSAQRNVSIMHLGFQSRG